MNEVLALFHHIHHKNGTHEVHHHDGSHLKQDEKNKYEVKHCSCKKHSITTETAVSHMINKDLKPVEFLIKFSEKCADGGYHIESGKLISKTQFEKPTQSHQQ